MEGVLTRNLEGRYQAERVLGAGGMGTVVKAYDTALKRDVAIKLLSPALLQNTSAVEIFLTEARALAALSHLNLVSVYDIVEAGEGVSMIQEFVHGATLEQEIMTRGALPEDEVLIITLQLLSVVGYLHYMGYLHRDLKPANMILSPDGHLRLVDFGLSRKFDKLLSRGTEVRGTPAYMAPEQIKSRDLTPATDIYQLGVTLFEMLTGQLPFETNGDTYALAYAHVNEKPPMADAINPQVSPELAAVVNRCLKKKPQNRYADCLALLEAINEVYRGRMGHDVEESGYLIPFGPVGVGETEEQGLRSSGSFLATSRQSLARNTAERLPVSFKTSDLNLSPDSIVERDGLDASSEMLRQVDAPPARGEVSAVLAPAMSAPAEAPARAAESRRVGLLAMGALVAVLLIGLGAWYVVSNAQGERGRGEAAAPTQAVVTVEAPAVAPPLVEAQVAPQVEAPVAEPPVAEIAPPEEVEAPEALEVTPPAEVEAPVAEEAPVEVEAPPVQAKAPVRRKAPVKKAAPARKPPAERPASEAKGGTEGKKNYLDSFEQVDVKDSKKLDDDLKALSDEL